MDWGHCHGDGVERAPPPLPPDSWECETKGCELILFPLFVLPREPDLKTAQPDPWSRSHSDVTQPGGGRVSLEGRCTTASLIPVPVLCCV